MSGYLSPEIARLVISAVVVTAIIFFWLGWASHYFCRAGWLIIEQWRIRRWWADFHRRHERRRARPC
jgi:hypothetical protein